MPVDDCAVSEHGVPWSALAEKFLSGQRVEFPSDRMANPDKCKWRNALGAQHRETIQHAEECMINIALNAPDYACNALFASRPVCSHRIGTLMILFFPLNICGMEPRKPANKEPIKPDHNDALRYPLDVLLTPILDLQSPASGMDKTTTLFKESTA